MSGEREFIWPLLPCPLSVLAGLVNEVTEKDGITENP